MLNVGLIRVIFIVSSNTLTNYVCFNFLAHFPTCILFQIQFVFHFLYLEERSFSLLHFWFLVFSLFKVNMSTSHTVCFKYFHQKCYIHCPAASILDGNVGEQTAAYCTQTSSPCRFHVVVIYLPYLDCDEVTFAWPWNIIMTIKQIHLHWHSSKYWGLEEGKSHVFS